MQKVTKTGRDAAELTDAIQRWMQHHYALAETPKLRALEIISSSGLSSETLIIDADFPGRDETRFILRAPPPADSGLFPEYDIALQAEIQSRLAAAGIPVPLPLAYEGDLQWLGCPFMIMPFIAGRSPSDHPNYIDEGWVKEMSGRDQGKLVENFVHWAAAINKLPLAQSGLDVAARKVPGRTPLEQEFRWWKDYLHWLGRREFTDDMHSVAKVIAWCEANWPDSEPETCFVWGDARPSNVIFADDLSVLGMLDFENAGLGVAEVDLGTWLTHRQNLMSSRGGTFPELPGYPDRQQSIEMYETAMGRKLRDVRWHEMFAAARQGAAVAGIRMMWRQRGMGERPITAVTPEWQLAAMAEGKRG